MSGVSQLMKENGFLLCGQGNLSPFWREITKVAVIRGDGLDRYTPVLSNFYQWKFRQFYPLIVKRISFRILHPKNWDRQEAG